MKHFLFITLLILVTPIMAQVGINNENPQAMFDIISKGNTQSTKALRITNSADKETVTILDNGNLGLGVTNPSIRVDLRDGSNSSALGIGYTPSTASVAGVGTIMYNNSTKRVNYSEGTSWIPLDTTIIKAFVTANLDLSSQIFTNNASTTVGSWTKIMDLTNSLNASTGIFTAPRSSIYTVNINFCLKEGAINSDTELNLIIQSSSGEAIKCVTGYNSAVTIPASSSCSGSLNVPINGTLSIVINQNLGSDKTLNPGYSYMSIIEN